MYSKWDRWLFTQVDNTALVLFRMLFGLLLACEAFGSIALGAVNTLFIEPDFTFTFIGFEFLEPLPGNWMYVLYVLMGIAGLLVMVGYKYRMALLFYAISWAYVYLMQKSSYNNHCYLLMLLNFLMLLFPANRSASLDALWNPSLRKEHMSRWIYVFIITFLGIIYAYASVAKFYPDWLDGSFPKYLMSTRGRDFDILQQDWVHQAILYFGLFFDLLIVPLLLWKKTRWLAVIASVFFHVFNSVVFQIGIFPYLALSFLLFFFSTEVLHKRFLWKKSYYVAAEVLVPKTKKLIVFSGTIFLLAMLLLPLRHWIIEDDVLWTEEGHRLSWRMMLRSRVGSGAFYIVEKDTGKKTAVQLEDYLSLKQQRSVQSKPDFIWQFAQELEEIYAEEGKEIEVYADLKVSINGRIRKQFTDPTVDLTQEEWSHFKHHKWILASSLYKENKRLKN
ncbi:HTTM domain-containing protein [uncultured Nonlabens sp.]|uniref:HTTM domain-containing protein n=1 Tax=uncultured Nonlabens sp. TaxID=859306 RepID=UPI0030D91D44|tara:strand:+ start:149759 stop:151099 length:1341 start_codon:yes stop_codon:yes gene_type:complete